MSFENERKCSEGTPERQFPRYSNINLTSYRPYLIAIMIRSIIGRFEYSVSCNIIQVFTALFTVEILFRLVAMGPMAFIRSRWNVFDTTVVSGSLLGYFYKSAEGLSIFRTLRLVSTEDLSQSLIKNKQRFLSSMVAEKINEKPMNT